MKKIVGAITEGMHNIIEGFLELGKILLNVNKFKKDPVDWLTDYWCPITVVGILIGAIFIASEDPTSQMIGKIIITIVTIPLAIFFFGGLVCLAHDTSSMPHSIGKTTETLEEINETLIEIKKLLNRKNETISTSQDNLDNNSTNELKEIKKMLEELKLALEEKQLNKNQLEEIQKEVDAVIQHFKNKVD